MEKDLNSSIKDNNKELIDSILMLIEDRNFIRLEDKTLQNNCIYLLKNVAEKDIKNIKLVVKIILDIIIVTDNNYIQDYLIEKIKYIKTQESLKLILMLTPILNEFSNEDEYVNVIDSLEDKSGNLTKKLVINFNENE